MWRMQRIITYRRRTFNMKDFYNYKVKKVVNVYDGDTITVDIDLGFNMVMCNQKLRLYGINTPEVRGEEREEGND